MSRLRDDVMLNGSVGPLAGSAAFARFTQRLRDLIESGYRLVTGWSFCTKASERVYITDRTGFFVPLLERVSGGL